MTEPTTAAGHKHQWVFDGDDPWVICACGERRDAITGKVFVPAEARQQDASGLRTVEGIIMSEPAWPRPGAIRRRVVMEKIRAALAALPPSAPPALDVDLLRPALRRAVEFAFEDAKNMGSYPAHPHLGLPYWPFEEFVDSLIEALKAEWPPLARLEQDR